LLLDELLPEPEFSEHHEVEVAAAPPAVYGAVCELTAAEARLLGPAAALRALPTVIRHPRRLLGTTLGAAGGVVTTPVMQQLRDAGFVELAAAPPDEVVVGVVGRLWTLTDTAPVELTGAGEFVAFSEPGYAKAALNFAVVPRGSGSRLMTETRVVTTSADAHRRFARYFQATLGPAGIIRRSWLAAIRRRAERDG